MSMNTESSSFEVSTTIFYSNRKSKLDLYKLTPTSALLILGLNVLERRSY